MTPWKEALERAAKRLPPTYEGSFSSDSGVDWDDLSETAQYAARACVLEALDALEKAGYVVVPREPTESQLAAFWSSDEHSGPASDDAYTAMIQAWEKERDQK